MQARVPFLDKAMLDATMSLDPDQKMIRCAASAIPPRLVRRFISAHSANSAVYAIRKGEETQFVEKWLMRAAFDVAVSLLLWPLISW